MVPDSDPAWCALRERLEGAADTLYQRLNKLRSHTPEHDRVTGKVQGVNLALSYMDEYERQLKGVSYDETK